MLQNSWTGAKFLDWCLISWTPMHCQSRAIPEVVVGSPVQYRVVADSTDNLAIAAVDDAIVDCAG